MKPGGVRANCRRPMTALPTLAAVIILSFVLMRIAPGGPFDGERPLDPQQTRAALDESLWPRSAAAGADRLSTC